MLHISLGHEADLLIIAPITANSMAKLAHGTADDLLSVTALAARCPVLIAPAMDGGMFSHPATQANLQTLRDRGVHIIGPESGHLASGLVAAGRMSEPMAILGMARYILSRTGPLAGRHVVVTAGGTREPIDPVRYITNRSSGKQGYALAQAALDAGADVTLISAADLPAPAGATLIEVGSVAEMAEAVLRASQGADALIMAAAVSDFRAAEAADQKIKKGEPGRGIARDPSSGHHGYLDGGGRTTGRWGGANPRRGLRRRNPGSAGQCPIQAGPQGAGPDRGQRCQRGGCGLWRGHQPGYACCPRTARWRHLPLMGKDAVAERVIEWVVEKL